MKTRYLRTLALAALLGTSVLNAADNGRMETTFSTDDSGNVTPQMFVPMYWNDNWFSGLGYSNSGGIGVLKEQGDYIVYDNGADAAIVNEITTIIDTMNIWVNILNYQSSNDSGFNYSTGVIADYKSIKKNEFGIQYYKYNPATYGDIADSASTRKDNSVELQAYSTFLNIEISYKNFADFLSFRLGGNISPYTSLELKQSIEFDSAYGDASSTTTQDISYKFLFDLYAESGSGIDFSFAAMYDYLPLEYDVAAINSDKKVYNTTLKTIDRTTKLDFKLVYSGGGDEGMRPMIGYSMLSYDSTLNGADLNYASENQYLFGFEKKF